MIVHLVIPLLRLSIPKTQTSKKSLRWKKNKSLENYFSFPSFRVSAFIHIRIHCCSFNCCCCNCSFVRQLPSHQFWGANSTHARRWMYVRTHSCTGTHSYVHATVIVPFFTHVCLSFRVRIACSSKSNNPAISNFPPFSRQVFQGHKKKKMKRRRIYFLKRIFTYALTHVVVVMGAYMYPVCLSV